MSKKNVKASKAAKSLSAGKKSGGAVKSFAVKSAESAKLAKSIRPDKKTGSMVKFKSVVMSNKEPPDFSSPSFAEIDMMTEGKPGFVVQSMMMLDEENKDYEYLPSEVPKIPCLLYKEVFFVNLVFSVTLIVLWALFVYLFNTYLRRTSLEFPKPHWRSYTES